MKLFTYALLGVFWLLSANTLAIANDYGQLKIKWSVNVDQRLPNSPVALSAPAVMLHGKDTWVVLAGRDRWVHVYDLDGSEVRRIFLGKESDSGSLLLKNGLVIVGDIAGRIHAVDPVKGEVVWQAQLTGAFTGLPVAIANDFLVQTTDNRIYRFSQDGEKKWSYAGQNSILSMYLNASPLVEGESIFAFFNNGDAVALKAESGDLLWKRQLLLSGDTAILSDLKAPLATPVLVSSLYLDGEKSSNTLLMPFYQGDLVAVSAKDGSQVLSLGISLKTAPVILGSTLYAAESTGFLHAYNIEKGGRMWSKKISSNELLGPVLFKGSLWMTDNKGMIYNVGLDGELHSSVEVAGSIVRRPIITKAGLLVRTDRGAMYLVDQ